MERGAFSGNAESASNSNKKSVSKSRKSSSKTMDSRRKSSTSMMAKKTKHQATENVLGAGTRRRGKPLKDKAKVSKAAGQVDATVVPEPVSNMSALEGVYLEVFEEVIQDKQDDLSGLQQSDSNSSNSSGGSGWSPVSGPMPDISLLAFPHEKHQAKGQGGDLLTSHSMSESDGGSSSAGVESSASASSACTLLNVDGGPAVSASWTSSSSNDEQERPHFEPEQSPFKRSASGHEYLDAIFPCVANDYNRYQSSPSRSSSASVSDSCVSPSRSAVNSRAVSPPGSCEKTVLPGAVRGADDTPPRRSSPLTGDRAGFLNPKQALPFLMEVSPIPPPKIEDVEESAEDYSSEAEEADEADETDELSDDKMTPDEKQRQSCPRRHRARKWRRKDAHRGMRWPQDRPGNSPVTTRKRALRFDLIENQNDGKAAEGQALCVVGGAVDRRETESDSGAELDVKQQHAQDSASTGKVAKTGPKQRQKWAWFSSLLPRWRSPEVFKVPSFSRRESQDAQEQIGVPLKPSETDLIV